MEHCVPSWEYVETEQLNLSCVYILEEYSITGKLFYHLPVEESETQVSEMHPSAFIDLIVYCEHLFIELTVI
jgi:hypothetical protein